MTYCKKSTPWPRELGSTQIFDTTDAIQLTSFHTHVNTQGTTQYYWNLFDKHSTQDLTNVSGHNGRGVESWSDAAGYLMPLLKTGGGNADAQVYVLSG